MASVTLSQGIESTITQLVPEVARVVDVTNHAEGSNPDHEQAKKQLHPPSRPAGIRKARIQRWNVAATTYREDPVLGRSTSTPRSGRCRPRPSDRR
jgi:hypothetical protein